ncbi:NADH-ubiquinone oxidoreductase chain 5, partial [Cucurbita argyrosperma subsp. argyrosperma]
MSEDPHSPRFMCYLSIFTFFMPMLVTGDNSLQLFLGWERSRSCFIFVNSFLADKAAIKAMPVNRVGDFGLAPGISGRFTLFQTVDFSTIFARASAPRNSWISCNMRLNAIDSTTQLGYMIFACGISNYSVSVFHLMNHAFFKALLFLSAGSVIHAMSDEQDMRKMGGLASSFPFTYAMMLMGSLSLIGFPFLTGFYSKDVILEKKDG